MSDKYPPASGRRRFVTGVVGSSTLAGFGTGSMAALNEATDPGGVGGGTVTYLGIENTDGPAPRGMPLVPLTTDDDGYLAGRWPDDVEDDVATTTIAGYEYSSAWYQYCGLEDAEGIEPTADQDDYLRSPADPKYEWQTEATTAGDRLHPDDFADYEEWGNDVGETGYGKPAMATWRSEGEGVKTIPVQVLRTPKLPEMIAESDYGDWLRETTVRDCIAWVDKCTHFCCVPKFKLYAGSAKFDAENEVYCQCHQSAYDPFSVVEADYPARPRPRE